MNKHYYFAYGANTNLIEMLERCPNAIKIGRAFVQGYTFRWRKYADIEISQDEYVNGLLWELDEQNLKILDEFEGYPDLYFRQRVIIEHNNKKFIGWAYMMTNQNIELEPDQDYKDTLFEGYKQNAISEDQLINSLKRFISD